MKYITKDRNGKPIFVGFTAKEIRLSKENPQAFAKWCILEGVGRKIE